MMELFEIPKEVTDVRDFHDEKTGNVFMVSFEKHKGGGLFEIPVYNNGKRVGVSYLQRELAND